MDEPLLIRRALNGDAAAERQLYDTHVDRVYRLCYRMAGDDELAREFTQETFIRAFDRLRAFRGDAALSTWLHSIAVSVSLNGLRRVKRFYAREAGLEEALHVGEGRPDRVEPDLKARLKRAIESLPEKYRVVFLMHDAEGYTHEEIGATLDVPVGTSKARLSRARARLREALADFAEEFAP
ncbi:MAG TPA: sigma-70 family RNA polymerase sigma factor [Longimicrobiales bacterium]